MKSNTSSNKNIIKHTTRMKKIIIINGPNLNLLGKREPTVYGNQDFQTYFNQLKEKYTHIELTYFQSNAENDIIDKIQQVGFEYTGIVLNAGAYTHTSLAIADAIRAVSTPVIEVHISNVHQRETYRHFSYLSSACKGIITGFGLQSYELAINGLI